MIQVVKLSEAEDKTQFGGKASNLAKLLKAGLPVPSGVVVGLSAFNDQGGLNDSAKLAIESEIDKGKLYAVRSSALAEDAKDASWAGQFESFLDTKPEEVTAKVELCHNSAKSRAVAYASDKTQNSIFDIAVVVQEMVQPEYAGVLFTKDPLSGKDLLVTEYVEGLGEDLVSGRVDPKRVVFGSVQADNVPFDSKQLAALAKKVEKLFGSSQDIEWAWSNNKMWLVQARPITAVQEARKGYYLGEPDDLFYWGPTRAEPMYMSDFLAAAERFFIHMTITPGLPDAPKIIALFHKGKNVWLINAKDFAEFTEKTFIAYEGRDRLDADIIKWQEATSGLDLLTGDEFKDKLVDAWYATEFAEFSLYGAESVLVKRLSRFDAKTRQEIWGAFTVPDKPTFLNRIDAELASSRDYKFIANKYSWVQDGYGGLSSGAVAYFKERLQIVDTEGLDTSGHAGKRSGLIKKLGLTCDEIRALNLARNLAEFMDDRKAWMMQTRKLITESVGSVINGWFYDDGKSELIGEDDTRELWQRYVDFKVSESAVGGVVASSGGKHFVNGEVVVVASPTDIVQTGRIIVVPSTSPSYVPLMRTAKALVTDHGGMMSHAAIVAREFNLPCIVGTKRATKVLKTGDKVVLDMAKGEVVR